MTATKALYDAVFAFLVVFAVFATLAFCLIVVMTVLFTNGGPL